MNEKEFNLILKQGEGHFVEFKEQSGKSLDKEIVAFANSKGGKIFIGIDDGGFIKGVNNQNTLKSKIIDIGKNLSPSLIVEVKSYKNVLIVEIKEGKDKPYCCRDGFYIRIGATSQKLERDEIIEFIIKEGRVFFDCVVNKDFRYPDDIDDNKFDAYIEEAKISKDLGRDNILKSLDVLCEIDGELKINNAGVLFFAKNVSDFFDTSKVVCAEFATNEKVKILDKKVYDNGIYGKY